MEFKYIAIEGPMASGKTALVERLGARLDAALVLEEADNPFLGDFYAGRPGSPFQAQLFYLLSRHRQQTAMRQADLFSECTLSDYLFERDRLYAFLNLDDNELFIYQRLYDLLARDAPPPDLVIYLQTPTDLLIRRLRNRPRDAEHDDAAPAAVDERYVREVNEAYNRFFFHYTTTPLLVIETSQINLASSDADLDDVLRQIRAMGRGVQYDVPRNASS